MIAILTGPIALLCVILTVLCFKSGCRKQALVIGGLSIFFLALTAIIAWAGYYTWVALDSGAV